MVSGVSEGTHRLTTVTSQSVSQSPGGSNTHTVNFDPDRRSAHDEQANVNGFLHSQLHPRRRRRRRRRRCCHAFLASPQRLPSQLPVQLASSRRVMTLCIRPDCLFEARNGEGDGDEREINSSMETYRRSAISF